MIPRTLEFVAALRAAGIPVAISESLDALNALDHVPLEDRSAVRAGFAATMIKDDQHRVAFEGLFDIYFGAGPPPKDVEDLDALMSGTSAEAFLEDVSRAVRSGSGGALRDLAQRAVSAFGRIDSARSTNRYYEYPIFRSLDLGALTARLTSEFEDDPLLSPLQRAIARDEFERRVQEFRNLIRSEVRRRVVDRKGPEAVASYAVRPLPKDIEIATAGADEMADLRRSIAPLARKLATRLALKHKRASRGRLDVRKTVRHSLSTGGVPFDVRLKRRVPHRPEVFVLCDVSDSVARFARFSLMLVHALQAQFTRVRSFAFIDTVDEVTRLFEHEDFFAAVDRMKAEAEVVWLDTNSNYGTALERFWDTYGSDVGPRTTLLILGDARSNNRTPRDWVLKELRAKAHKIYWLNPEAQTYWDTGDSIASLYAAHVDDMIEVRNLSQLEDFVARTL